MTIPIRIDPVDRDHCAAGCPQPDRPVGKLRCEVLAASRGRRVDGTGGSTDDPFLDCWRKLLAKYCLR